MKQPSESFPLNRILIDPLPEECGPLRLIPVHKIFLLPEQIEMIRQARSEKREKIELSTNIGLSTETACFESEGTVLAFRDGTRCSLEKIPKLKKRTFYHVESGELQPFHFFCGETKKVYKLLPTRDIPSFSISSAPMHQITYSSPARDTRSKIESLSPFSGKEVALDTCFGLGYSSGRLAETVHHVVSCEFDLNSLELARLNPYSRATIQAINVTILRGDIFELIELFRNDSFDLLLHDPPTPKISPMLYSADFYLRLKRVLKPGGRLFHYTPRPNVQKRKRNFPKEIERRLRQNGFQSIQFCEQAQGLIATL